MNERRMVSADLAGTNSEIASFLGRLMSEEDPRSTVEFTVALGRAAHLLGLRLQSSAVLLARFSRFEDFGPELDAEADAEEEVEDASLTRYEARLAGIDALRQNPHFPPDLLRQLFGEVAEDGNLPGRVVEQPHGRRADDQI
ncbi:hypothetical protein AB0I60_34660 [Actinosynnema sp. NPDC050436]|uniref:hypothetical protein n=1 Tax=Actinosynnema sp. NPDC050436 TaxID=3155659 RepID=UPI0033CE42C6